VISVDTNILIYARVQGSPWHEPDAASPQFPRCRIIDARLARTLRCFGVQQFATVNIKDFEPSGFQKVWNPLTTREKRP
jgi:hypothetical protein